MLPPPHQPYRLTSTDGMQVAILARGAAIASIKLPLPIEVCLTYADPRAYAQDAYFLGSTVGRYAGRIDRGRLPFEGGLRQLAVGGAGGEHCLHGGPRGFDTRLWELQAPASETEITLGLHAHDGEAGFPGELRVTVRYQLLPGWRLAIDYDATCTTPTLINLANHAYFNLDGDGQSILQHELQLDADRYTPLTNAMIPTGEISAVEHTRFDLRRPTRLADHFNRHPQLADGLDQNFVINGEPGQLRRAARLHSSRTGIRLEVSTTQPGLQVYVGGQLGKPWNRFAGLCLEAQNFPNAPWHANFPSPWLAPGQRYRQRTVYAFSGSRRHQ